MSFQRNLMIFNNFTAVQPQYINHNQLVYISRGTQIINYFSNSKKNEKYKKIHTAIFFPELVIILYMHKSIVKVKLKWITHSHAHTHVYICVLLCYKN